MSYSSMTWFDDELIKGVLEFYGLELDIPTAEAEILDVECERVRFYPWFLWDWRGRQRGPTVGERFLADHQHGDVEARLLKALNASYIGFYEAMTDAQIGGVQVRDLATDEILHISDDGLAGEFMAGQILQARLVRVHAEDNDEIVLVDAVYACLPADTKAAIQSELKGLIEGEKTGPGSTHAATEALKRCASECLYFADQLLESLARPPAARNGDDDPLTLCHSTLLGEEADAVWALLEHDPDFAQIDGHIWKWQPQGNHLGFAYRPRRGRLVLGANSVSRHDRLQEAVANLAGIPSARLKSLMDFHDAVERWTTNSGGYPWLIGDPDVPQALVEWLEFWARSWADLPSSALDGRTPREAVRNPQGRNRVERVLARFASLKLGHLTHEGTRCINRVRSELGLDPVG